MATTKITSPPSKTKVGTTGTEVNTFTETTYEVDSSGKIIANSATSNLYYSPAPNSYLLAATSKDGGKTWTYTKDPNSANGYLLGDDTINSLEKGALKTTTQQQITDSATKANIPAEEQKKLASSTENSATSTETNDEEKSGVSAEDQAKVEADAKTTAQNTRTSFPSDLHYPEKLRYSKQDVLKIEMLKYEPRPLESSSLSGFGSRSATSKRVIGSVYLPIPAGISDSNGVSWSEDRMTPLQAAGVDLGKAFITGGGKAAAGVAGEKTGAVTSNVKTVQSFIMNKILESATGTENLLSRTMGVIENPNMELLFTSPQLRSFSFTYKLSSRSKKETDQIRQIIRFFKQGMAVQRTEAQLFLRAPHTFQLTYKHLNEDHKYLNKFKECALTNFSVDYTPEGQYATFKDGAMVSYQLTMQFQELEPVFNDEYPQDDDASIGY